MLPALAGAAPIPGTTTTSSGFFRFCAEAQIPIANIDTAKLVENGGEFTTGATLYRSEADFVSSKSSVVTASKTIQTTQWTQYTDVNQTQPKLVRCKFRTGESLDQGAWPNGEGNNGGRFDVEPTFGFGPAGAGLSTNAVDQPCEVINATTISNVWASLSPTEKNQALYNPTGTATANAAPNTLVTIADDMKASGPAWTPPVPAVILNGSVLEVQSRALLVPSTIINLARFLGAHYCTLVAPEFLKRVILGQAAPS